jgi:hypothetical protein
VLRQQGLQLRSEEQIDPRQQDRCHGANLPARL